MRKLTPIIACALVAAAFHQSHACSTCIAHALGAALQGVGAQTLEPHRLLLSVGYMTFSKSNAADEPGTTEHEDTTHQTLDLVYGMSHRTTLGASLPYVRKAIASSDGSRETGNGWGDATLGFTAQTRPSVQAAYLIAYKLDLKLPTGENSQRNVSGDLKEQHLQPGTGSTDVTGGVALTAHGFRFEDLWFSNLRVRLNGANSRGYRYGNVLFYGVGYLRSLARNSALVAELNGRFAAKDTAEDGSRDPNSGGHLCYLALTYRHALTNRIGLIASFQVPVIKGLNGVQSEGNVVSLSLMRDL